MKIYRRRRALLLGLLLWSACVSGADAANDFWQNSSLGDWFVSGNWSAAVGVPTATADVFIGTGGTALINAPNAQAQRLFIGAPSTTGASGAILLGSNAGKVGSLTVGSDITIGESVSAGYVGNGTVTVSAGAQLIQNSGNLNIGQGTQGSTGTLKITDANSFMTTAAPTFIGLGNNHGNFTVQNGGEIFTGPAELADGASSSGVATVTGVNSRWYVTGGFTVGYAGSGTLTVSGGGLLAIQGPNNTLSDTSVAAFAGSTGSVTVTGAGSAWYMANLFLGGRDNGGAGIQGGSGSLNITSGGYVQAANVKFFGGAFTVDNGSLNNPGLSVVGGKGFPSFGGPVGDMVVGNSTTGRMEIANGGFVFCNRGYVGIVSGSEGYVLVSNGEWVMTGSLFVANQGDGTLELNGVGAQTATHGNAYVGFAANTVGNLIVGGGNANSYAFLNVVGDLYLGGNAGGAGGSGVLRLNDYGAAIANTTTVYSTGGLAIGSNNMALQSPLTMLGGFIQFVVANNTTFPNNFTLGTGGVRIYTSGHPSTLSGNLTGGGGLTKGGGGSLGLGTLTLTGASNYAGATAVTTGTLLVNGSITSPVTVSSGATLGGSGTVGAVTVNSGGIVAPGNSPGKLTVSGNYTQSSGAILNVELGGYSAGAQFDQIAASGIASLGGTLNLTLVNGFRPNVGDTFQIITSNGESGNFATINSTGFTVRSDVSASGAVLTVTGVTLPPPVTLTSAVSRKTHTGAGVFDVILPATGNVGVESRSGGATDAHMLVFTFSNPVTSVSSVSLSGGTGTVSSSAIGADTHQYIVNLTGVANAQTITVKLTNVSDAAGNNSSAVFASVGVLRGDSNGDGAVNSGDAIQVRNRSGQPVDGTNFRSDFNLDGDVNSGDAITARTLSGTAL